MCQIRYIPSFLFHNSPSRHTISGTFLSPFYRALQIQKAKKHAGDQKVGRLALGFKSRFIQDLSFHDSVLNKALLGVPFLHTHIHSPHATTPQFRVGLFVPRVKDHCPWVRVLTPSELTLVLSPHPSSLHSVPFT